MKDNDYINDPLHWIKMNNNKEEQVLRWSIRAIGAIIILLALFPILIKILFVIIGLLLIVITLK